MSQTLTSFLGDWKGDGHGPSRAMLQGGGTENVWTRDQIFFLRVVEVCCLQGTCSNTVRFEDELRMEEVLPTLSW